MAPRLIESCFQTAGIWEMGTTGRMGLARAHRPGHDLPSRGPINGDRLFVVAMPRNGGYDAEIVDAQGLVCVSLRGYRTAELPAPVDAEAARASRPRDGLKVTHLSYLFTLSSEVPPSDDWLCPEEEAKLAELRFAKRRGDWRQGRWTAKRALDLAWQREHSGLPPRWLVRAAADGAPEAFFADGEPAPFLISLSHSGGLAMAAVAGREHSLLGCDVERIEPRSDELVAQFFTPDEQRGVHAVGEEGRALAACLIWSAKESALKALRSGLRADTRSVSVSWDARVDAASWQPLRVLELSSARELAGHWRTVSPAAVDARTSWVASLVAATPTGEPEALRALPLS